MDYRDKIYSKYVSKYNSDLYNEVSLVGIKKQFPVWQEYFGRFLPENKTAKIIDLGCGNGGFAYWLQEVGFHDANGIDVSEEQIEAAEKLGIKNVSRADLREFLPDKKMIYDLIFSRDLLEHFSKEEVFEILYLIYRSLKEGGIFVCQTTNAENLLWGRLRHGDFTHEVAFTEKSMRQLLRLAGFKTVKIYPMGPVIHGFKSLLRFIIWKFFEVALHFYLLVETGSSKGIFTQNIIVVGRK